MIPRPQKGQGSMQLESKGLKPRRRLPQNSGDHNNRFAPTSYKATVQFLPTAIQTAIDIIAASNGSRNLISNLANPTAQLP